MLTAKEVEAHVGCPNKSCYAEGFKPCVDRRFGREETMDEPHKARRKIAESIQRDYETLGYLPEHGDTRSDAERAAQAVSTKRNC